MKHPRNRAERRNAEKRHQQRKPYSLRIDGEGWQ